MSGNPFMRLRDLAARYCDVPRPIIPAIVTDVSQWVYPGNAYIQVETGGAGDGRGVSRRAIYRDGPAPVVGDTVQVVRMASDTGAGWLAFPLPQPQGCGQLYVSAYSLADSSWHIIRCDTAVGNVWQELSGHPLAGSYARRPLQRLSRFYNALPGSYLSFAYPRRLHTWGSDADYTNPGAHYYSDDNGATWTASGISIVNMTANPANEGWLYAVSPTTVYGSDNGGASWVTLTGTAPPGSYRAIWVSAASGSQSIAIATTDGVYNGFVLDDGISPPIFGGWAAGLTGPTPGTSIALISGVAFDGDATYISGTPYTGPWTGTFTTGAGEAFDWVVGPSGTYAPATDHPNGLTDIPVAGHARIRVTPPSGTDGGDGDYCNVIGLDDATTGSGHTRYVVQPGAFEPWAVLDSRQVSDLGAAFVPSADGVSW